MSSVQASPSSNDGGWSDANKAYVDGGSPNASTITTDAAVKYWGYSFSGLPTNIHVDGLAVRADAFQFDDSASYQLDVYLSWDDGTSWTSAKNTGDLTNLEATYTLGGSSDSWGHTWTDAEARSHLRVKVIARGSGPDQVWELDWIPVTLYYTDATPVVMGLSESLSLADTITSQNLAMALKERIPIQDGSGYGLGGGPGGASGQLIDDIAGGGPDWEAASEQFVRAEAFEIELIMQGATLRVFRIGEPIHVAETVPPGNDYQPGVLEWGDLTLDGNFAADNEVSDAMFRVRNTTLADQLTGAVVDFATEMQQLYVIGAFFRLWCSVLDGGVWYSKLIFTGVVEDAECREGYIEIRVSQANTDEVQIPSLLLDDRAFVWGANEGKRPEGFSGTAVPVGYGRFGPSAIKTYAAGCPIAWDGVSDDAYQRRLGDYFALISGMRCPVLPVPLGADMYSGLSTDIAPFGLDRMKQALFVYGDLLSAPFVTLNAALTSNQRFNALRFPSDRGSNAEFVWGLNAGTWDSSLDRGVPFGQDDGTYQLGAASASGAGDSSTIRPTLSSTGTMRFAEGFYVNRTKPIWSESQEYPYWNGAIQIQAIPMAGLSQIKQTTAAQLYGTTTIGAPAVINPEAALDPDPETYAVIPVGGRLSLQLPAAGSPAGDIVAVRVCWLTNSGASNVTGRFTWRWSYSHTGLPFVDTFTTQLNAQNVTFPANQAPLYHSAWLVRPREAFLQKPPSDDGTKAPSPGGWTSAWDFTHWSLLIGSSTQYVTYAGDVLFALDSGSSVNLRIVYVWMEVIYKSSFQAEARNRMQGLRAALSRHNFRLIPGGSARRTPPPVDLPFRSNIPEDATPGQVGGVYLEGIGPRDDTNGTYTGTASAIIENPADIARHLIVKYLGAATTVASGAGVFGSLSVARDALNALAGSWRLTLPISNRTTLHEVFLRLQEQSQSMIQCQLNDSGAPEWRYFPDMGFAAAGGGGPGAERLYRADGYGFRWDRIQPGSFSTKLSDRRSIANSFVLRYGLHVPTGEFAFQRFVSTASTNIATSASLYTAACLASKNRYGIDREVNWDAPDVWSHAVADQLIKWICDSRRERRALVQFDTYVNGVDLKPGHVIKFDDEIGQRVAYPSYGSASWSAHSFNVLNVRPSKGAKRAIGVHVTAIECYTKAE